MRLNGARVWVETVPRHSNGFRHVPNSEVIRHCIHTRVEWRLETD